MFANYEAVEIEREHGCELAEFDLGLPVVDEEAIAVLGVEHLSYLWVFLGCAMSVSLLADGYTRRYKIVKNSLSAVRRLSSTKRVSVSVDGGALAMEAEEPLPEGWERVSSRSRPGQVSYLNTTTGRRVMQRPTEPASGSSNAMPLEIRAPINTA